MINLYKMIEDKFDQIMSNLKEIEKKVNKKIESQEKQESRVKNSHIHLMINTSEKKKLVERAKNDGLDLSEWCRRKLREDSQLNRIEEKIDKLIS
jgi:hypothetical protein